MIIKYRLDFILGIDNAGINHCMSFYGKSFITDFFDNVTLDIKNLKVRTILNTDMNNIYHMYKVTMR